MTNDEFEVYLFKYKSVIKALARKLARKDNELNDDLRQVGMIALWELDPSKATTNPDAFIRQVLYNKMADVLRRDRPRDYESLTTHLARGDQLIEDPDTGDARLTLASNRPRSPERGAEQDEDEEF